MRVDRRIKDHLPVPLEADKPLMVGSALRTWIPPRIAYETCRSKSRALRLLMTGGENDREPLAALSTIDSSLRPFRLAHGAGNGCATGGGCAPQQTHQQNDIETAKR
jgi:hypothetical protein